MADMYYYWAVGCLFAMTKQYSITCLISPASFITAVTGDVSQQNCLCRNQVRLTVRVFFFSFFFANTSVKFESSFESPRRFAIEAFTYHNTAGACLHPYTAGKKYGRSSRSVFRTHDTRIGPPPVLRATRSPAPVTN